MVASELNLRTSDSRKHGVFIPPLAVLFQPTMRTSRIAYDASSHGANNPPLCAGDWAANTVHGVAQIRGAQTDIAFSNADCGARLISTPLHTIPKENMSIVHALTIIRSLFYFWCMRIVIDFRIFVFTDDGFLPRAFLPTATPLYSCWLNIFFSDSTTKTRQNSYSVLSLLLLEWWLFSKLLDW